MSNYFVVFEYTKKAGGYSGVRTFSSFQNKEDCERHKATMPSLLAGEETVIYEGTNKRLCQALVKATPMTAYVDAAFESARMPDGSLDPDVLKMHIMNIGVVIGSHVR